MSWKDESREVVAKMRGIIPRQMFDVAIQAAIGSNIVARENVKLITWKFPMLTEPMPDMA